MGRDGHRTGEERKQVMAALVTSGQVDTFTEAMQCVLNSNTSLVGWAQHFLPPDERAQVLHHTISSVLGTAAQVAYEMELAERWPISGVVRQAGCRR